MLKIAVSYSNKNGTEWASCSVSDLEFHPEILNDPMAFRDQVRTAYERCIDAVDTQLGVTIPTVNLETAGRPAPPATTARPAPAPAAGNGYGPVRTGKQLGGWLNGEGSLYKSQAFKLCRQHGYGTLFSALTDEQAVFLYSQLYGHGAAANVTETDHESHLRRQREHREETARASTAFARNGRH